MENIRQAVERARAGQSSFSSEILQSSSAPLPQHIGPPTVTRAGAELQAEEATLDSVHLASRRIVSHNGADRRSRPYDILRTQVLQSMTAKKWKILGVTSPTPGCGKTLTAVNLAFSIARQPDKSVVLVDMDLQKPQIANCLGLTIAAGGVLDLLQGRAALPDVAIPVRAGNQRIVVLPAAATTQSSELMGSHAMSKLLQDLRRDYQIIVLDLPPMLLSDDVIALAPQLDCVLLVAAIGLSKASEVEDCIRHLQPSQLLRVVANKATEANAQYNYY